MAGVNKGLSKGFKSFRKFSGGQQVQRALIGDKNYDKLHFISTSVINNADKADAAKKSANDAAALQAQLAQQQANELANLNEEENRRIKKLILGGRGTRGYRGSPMFRAAPGNSSGNGGGGGLSSSSRAASASGSGSTAAAAAARFNGTTGGMRSFRSVRQ